MPKPPRATVWNGGQLALNEGLVSSFLDGETSVGLYAKDETTIVVDPDSDDYILQTRGDFDGKVVNANGTIKKTECSRPQSSTEVEFTVSTAGEIEVNLDILVSE